MLCTFHMCGIAWIWWLSLIYMWCAFMFQSSRMRVMNHNWSATKQRLHLQSVAKISRHSALSDDRIRQCGTSSWVSPQGHRSVSASRHFLLQGPQCPCSVRKRFSRDLCCWGRSKPGCQTVGSHTRWELTTSADFHLCLHRLLMSAGCKSSHSGFLDVSSRNGGLRIWGWIGQLSCLTIFSTSLSVAAFLCRAGSSMLESTGSHGRGVEWRVPEMTVDLTCVSWAFPDWSTVTLLSARADDYKVLALAPKVEPTSFINKLFRFFSLPTCFNLMHWLHTYKMHMCAVAAYSVYACCSSMSVMEEKWAERSISWVHYSFSIDRE